MLFLFINPLFITAEYISVFKGRKSETSTYFGANISATIGLFCLVYLYFKNIGEELSFIHLSSFPIVFAIFLFLLLVVAMVCLKTNKGTVEQYRMSAARFQHIKYLHIMNIVCYLESIIFFCLSHRGLQEFYERAYFFPWLIYIVVMLSVKDPFVDIMIKKSISVINRKSIK